MTGIIPPIIMIGFMLKQVTIKLEYERHSDTYYNMSNVWEILPN
jgi:hypothetical protein